MSDLTHLLLFFIFIFSSYQLKLKVPSTISLPHNLSSVDYLLLSEEALGKVSYQITGLPSGLYLSNSRIQGSTNSINGTFPILISAVDEKNKTASKVCVLSIIGLNETNLDGSENSSGQIRSETVKNVKQQHLTNTLSDSHSFDINSEFREIVGKKIDQESSQQSIMPIQKSHFTLETNLNPQTTPTSYQAPSESINYQINPNPNFQYQTTAFSVPQLRPTGQKDIQSSLFDHQLKANQAISFLLDQVERLRERAQIAKRQVQNLQTQLQKSVEIQGAVQSKIKETQSKVSRFKQSMNKLNVELSVGKTQLSEEQSSYLRNSDQIHEKSLQLNNMETITGNKNKKKEQLQRSLQISKEKDKQYEKGLIKLQRKIQDLTFEMKRTEKQIINADIYIDDRARNIKNIDEEISDLKKRLDDAIERKQREQKQELRLRNLKVSVPTEISRIKSQIASTEKQIKELKMQRNANNIEVQNSEEELKLLEKDIEVFEESLQSAKKEIEDLKHSKGIHESNIRTKKATVSQIISTLNFLTFQLAPFQQNLKLANIESQQISLIVDNIRQKLLQSINNWQIVKQELTKALGNLEKARAEKQSIDLAIEHYLKSKSSLPFPEKTEIQSFVVNRQNTTKIDELYMNVSNRLSLQNPAELQIKQFIIPFYQKIEQTNLRNQVTNPIGDPSIHLSRTQSGTLMYNGQFECPQNLMSSQEKRDGRIIQIGLNVLVVDSTQQKFIAAICSCSKIYSSSMNSQLKIGDKVSIFGKGIGNNIFSTNLLYFGN